MVQWEAGGELKLDAAKRVRAIHKHDGIEWVFVDGSEAGIPMSEVIVESKGGQFERQSQPEPPRLPFEPDVQSGLRKAVFPVEDGDVTLIFPKGMTTGSFDELDQYMKIFLKKEKKKSAQEKFNEIDEALGDS